MSLWCLYFGCATGWCFVLLFAPISEEMGVNTRSMSVFVGMFTGQWAVGLC
jgi:hypothetical protein